MEQMGTGVKFCRAVILFLIILSCMLWFASCRSSGQNNPEPVDCEIEHDWEFGAVVIKESIDDFNDLGFEYGDSVNVVFSNGYTMEDIPYYSGYYGETGMPLLVAYQGRDFIWACINNGPCLWDVSGVSEDDTVTITLAEHGKYLDIQTAWDIGYTDDYSDYNDDVAFANFRSVKAGNIAPNTLYRSASPCNNTHNRAPYVDALCEEAGIQCIVDLADNEEIIRGYLEDPDFDSPYFLSLYEKGQVFPVSLNVNFTSDEFKEGVAAGLTVIIEHDGPYLVQCTEGKDRTGFVCMLLEALCGADYNEIVDDYMISFNNYGGITVESDPDRYNILVESLLDPMIRIVLDDPEIDVTTADLTEGAENYLKSIGLTDAEIDKLKAQLT